MRFDAASNPYTRAVNTAADASVDERAAFIVKTYLHLAGAIFGLVAVEAALIFSGAANAILSVMVSVPWFLVLLGFVAVSWVADRWARGATSLPMQYAGLGLYVVAQAVLLVPMLAIAMTYDPQAIPAAALVTLVLFGGLTGIVFLTRKDFSFMRGILGVAALGALGVMVGSWIFGFSLGILFSGAMVVLAGGYILYNTSNVLHHYRTDQHVSAALTLFADVALLFWYVLRIFLSSRD